MFGYLRLALALLVVSSHLDGVIFKFVDQGRAAVFGFYILAGLVTSKLYFNVFQSSIKSFLIDRALRIVPMAWAWLIISFLTLYIYCPENLMLSIGKVILHFLIIPLNYFAFIDVQTLSKPDVMGLNFILPPYFSLGIELQAYLLLAILFFFRSFFVLRAVAILSFLAFSFVTTFGLHNVAFELHFSYVILTSVFFPFYIGTLIYFNKTKELTYWYISIIGLLLLHIVRFSSFGVSPTAEIALIISIPIIKLIYDYRHIKLPLNHLLGSFSYIVYLNHMLFIYLKYKTFTGITFNWQDFIMISFLSILTAIPAYYLIERPLNKIRHFK